MLIIWNQPALSNARACRSFGRFSPRLFSNSREGEISVDSAKRLQALEQFTDLGSGYQLAMRDLEIRGANFLGSNNVFIAEIGFETCAIGKKR